MITPDHRLGFDMEQKYCEIIRTNFGLDLEPTSRFHSFDYESPSTVVELKTRRCKSNQYNDTMVIYNKIKKIPPGKKLILVFSFTDGLFYHEYDENIKYRISTGGRNDRGKDEYNTYFFVHKDFLRSL